jgi:hypothetical protein
MDCAGRVASGINTVHLSYVGEKTGHALTGARQWIPEEQVNDSVRSLATGLPPDLEFRTKGQLAIDIFTGVRTPTGASGSVTRSTRAAGSSTWRGWPTCALCRQAGRGNAHRVGGAGCSRGTALRPRRQAGPRPRDPRAGALTPESRLNHWRSSGGPGSRSQNGSA